MPFQVYESTSPGLCHFGLIKVPFQVYNSTSPGEKLSFRFIEVTSQVYDPPRFMEVTAQVYNSPSQVYDIPGL